jgi:hypothetical protein
LQVESFQQPLLHSNALASPRHKDITWQRGRARLSMNLRGHDCLVTAPQSQACQSLRLV